MNYSRRQMMQGLSLLTVSGALSGCGTHSWKQKLAVTVQTPSGEKSGASVVQVDSSMGYFIGAGVGADIKMQGEATVVDLGNGKYLFGLLSESSKSLAYTIFEKELPKGAEAAWDAISRKKGIVRSAPTLTMVTFGNMADPASVKEVNFLNFEAVFGSGYSLKSITLEITDEPVTGGVVEKVIPWIGDPVVMENPGWARIPESSRQLLGGFLTDYSAAQTRFTKGTAG